MAHRPTVVVTRRIYPEAIARLEEHCHVVYNDSEMRWERDELRARLADADAAVVMGTDAIDAHVLAEATRLQIVATISVGYNNLDIPALTAARVMATNTPDVLTDTTADLAFTLLLAAARRVATVERHLRNGDWKGFSILQDTFFGMDVHHTILGIVGMGRIGAAIARRARAFDMRILYHNRTRLPEDTEQSVGADYRTLAALLQEADHVLLILPYSAATHHLIGAAELATMKRTATLVNAGRGGLVDDEALAAALTAGTIAAAGLDVFEGEPTVCPALLAAPNTVLTPHVGSGTARTRRAMVDLAVDNVLAAIRGDEPPCLINPEARA